MGISHVTVSHGVAARGPEAYGTFHAIVGEAFAELVHHDEADAGRVIGATQFLKEATF